MRNIEYFSKEKGSSARHTIDKNKFYLFGIGSSMHVLLEYSEYHNKEMFKIYIYDVEGNLRHEIYEDKCNLEIFRPSERSSGECEIVRIGDAIITPDDEFSQVIEMKFVGIRNLEESEKR